MWGGGFKDLLSASADWEVQGFLWEEFIDSKSQSKCRSVLSDSLQPRGLFSSWNSPGQNSGVSNSSLLQGISQPRN